jgi:ribosomal protein L29
MKVKVVRAKNEIDLEKQLNELLAKSFELTDTLAFDTYGNIFTILKKNS